MGNPRLGFVSDKGSAGKPLNEDEIGKYCKCDTSKESLGVRMPMGAEGEDETGNPLNHGTRNKGEGDANENGDDDGQRLAGIEKIGHFQTAVG